jgi:S1-C subfamily serine protease
MNKRFPSSLRRSAHVHYRLLGVWIIALALLLSAGARAEFAEKVAERMKKSTVRVVIVAGDQVKGHGSGFIISKNGHVATNQHVIADAEELVVLYCEGDRVFMRRGELVAVSATADLAILKIDPIPSTEVVEIATTELVSGQPVMTVGFPGAIDEGSWATLEGVEIDSESGEGRITTPEARGDFEPAVFSGEVAKFVTALGTRLVLHSAKISPGNSGGPLVDADGRVCGINTALVPASMAGVDYPISIHASELVTLARAHSIPIDVTSSKASIGGVGGGSNMQMLLLIVLAAFAVVMFLIVLRKPRAVLVDAMSRVIRSHKHNRPEYTPRQPRSPAGPQSGHSRSSMPTGAQGSMRLRGRDLQGLSFDVAFSAAEFRRHGGRLVIGRNNDLSQLVVPHDSVSRQHATLITHGSSIQVEDRNSGNGTKVNGREIPVGSPPIPLNQGDKLTLGEVDLIFEVFH